MFNRLFKFFGQPQDSSRTQFQALILEPILTPSGLVDVGDDSPLDMDGDAIDLFLPPSDFGAEAIAAFESGYFTVGESGEIEIDFLFDGGKYQFELAIFSLEELDEAPGSEEFIREAARRALTNSTEGYAVISDRLEGAKFAGDLEEGKDWNAGKYLGTKAFKMEAGSHFGIMLVPNGTVEEIYENPDLGGSKAPLFSLSTANPDDRFHLAQIADVTGEGSLFAMEDVQEGHQWFDSDYNDLIFQVRGATGEAVDLDDLIDTGEDWRETDMGKAIIDYAEDAIAEELALPDVPEEQQPLVGVIDEGEFSGEESDSPTETRRDRLNVGQDRIDGDDNPLLPPGEEAETDILEAIENESTPLWVGRADGETWDDSLIEFVDEARGSGRENAIAYLALDSELWGEALGETQEVALAYARDNGVLVVAISDGEMGATSPQPNPSQEEKPKGESAIAKYDNIVTVGVVENAEKKAAELTGHFARVWGVNPELSYTQVIEIVNQTATAINPETGAAIVDVVAAGYLAAATTPDPNKLRLQPLPNAPYDPIIDWQGWESGVFTVGEEGKVTFDFLYDEGIYEGEVAIFNVAGLEAFKPGSPEFIAEVTRRILENEGGSVVFSDKTEAVRFYSEENQGNYNGIRTVEMEAGTEFGLMLVPNGTVAELAENPDLGLSKRPLFSLSPVNPVDGFDGGYLANVTGAVKAFAFEENRSSEEVREYRDLLFNLGGATGNVPLLEEVAPVGDWQNTYFGQIFKKAVSFVESENKIVDSLSSRVRMALKRSQNLDNYDPVALAGTREWVVGISPGQSPTQLAELFGAQYLKATGYIPNTYVWEFPETMEAQEIAQKLAGFTGVEFAYPLVPIAIDWGDRWQLRSSEVNAGNFNAADANVTKAWETARGEGVVVGIVDDGFDYQHEDLDGDKYRADLSRDFAEKAAGGTYDTDPHAIASRHYDYEETYHAQHTEGQPPKLIFPGATNYFGFHVYSGNQIENISVDVAVQHPIEGELSLTLVSPKGEKMPLVALGNGQYGLAADAVGTLQDKDPQGIWMLEIADAGTTGGSLERWGLTLDVLHGHGTKVTGVAVGEGNNPESSGVAPDASWAGLRLSRDRSTDLHFADSLSYLADEIDIYNGSWGARAFANLAPMTEYAIEGGATSGRDGLGNIYVFAAGNNAFKDVDGRPGSHANDDSFVNSRHTIAVGAINGEGKRSQYSETGASLLVSAYSSDRAYFESDRTLKVPSHESEKAFPLTVSGVTEEVDDVSVAIVLKEENISNLNDLTVTLVNPSGEEAELFSGASFIKTNDYEILPDGWGRSAMMTFSDSSDRVLTTDPTPLKGEFRPQDSLLPLASDPNGEWNLKVSNKQTGEEVKLRYWNLSLGTNSVESTAVHNEYSSFGGTSAAAPFVSGIVALMLEANPTLTQRDVQHILIQSAQPEEGKQENLNDPDDEDWVQNGAGYWVNHKYGFGAVNAEKAVNLAKDWTTMGAEILISDSMSSPRKIETDIETSSTINTDGQEDMTIEWVEVEFEGQHPSNGSTQIVLEHTYDRFNPTTQEYEEIVTRSLLNEVNQSSEDDFAWVFSSARHWGEPSHGDWTLKVLDEEPFSAQRSWGNWGLNLYGAKPMVSIEATDPEATEGEDPGEFTIYRTGNVEKELVVNYEIADKNSWFTPPAKEGLDYEAIPENSIIIPAGQSSVTIPIVTMDDDESEWTETVKINLTEANTYEISSNNTDTVNIWDSEIPEVHIYTEWYSGTSSDFHKHSYLSESGNTGHLVFRRTGDRTKDLTVNYSISGSAENGQDYHHIPDSVVIPAGKHWEHIYFVPIDDNEIEGEETIQISLLPDPDNYKIKTHAINVGENGGSVPLTIWDNEDRPTVTIQATDHEASEYGDPGEFTITRTGDITQPLVVDYWVSPHHWNRAKNDGSDFNLLPESITIPAGQSSVTIAVTPKDDDVVETKEYIDIFLVENENYAISSSERAIVNIFDGDTQALAWEKQLGTTEYDRANSIAFDSDNNVYIAGRTSGDLNGTNSGIHDSFVTKYDSSGNEQWKVQLGTEGYDEVSGIVVDKENNIYITGWTDGTIDGMGTERDAWIAKYNSSGGFMWKRELENSTFNYANDLAVDNSGNVYLTGRTSGEANIWFAKYDNNGNLIDREFLGTPLADEAHDIAVDNEGNIYIAGQTQGELGDKVYKEGDIWQNHYGDDADAWVAKYNSSGNPEWIKQLGTITEDIAHSISVSETGNIYLSGQTRGWLGDVYEGDLHAWKGDHSAWWSAVHNVKDDFGGTYYGETDAWVAQLDADGNLNWKRQLGTEASDRATSVVADSNGNVYLAGNSRGKMDDATHFGKDDAWIAKYDINGALQWRQQYGTDADDTVADIALAGDGIYLTGYTEGKLGETHFGKEDAWVMKLA